MWGPPTRSALRPSGNGNRHTAPFTDQDETSTFTTRSLCLSPGTSAPSVAIDGNPVETAHSKATPHAA